MPCSLIRRLSYHIWKVFAKRGTKKSSWLVWYRPARSCPILYPYTLHQRWRLFFVSPFWAPHRNMMFHILVWMDAYWSEVYLYIFSGASGGVLGHQIVEKPFDRFNDPRMYTRKPRVIMEILRVAGRPSRIFHILRLLIQPPHDNTPTGYRGPGNTPK